MTKISIMKRPQGSIWAFPEQIPAPPCLRHISKQNSFKSKCTFRGAPQENDPKSFKSPKAGGISTKIKKSTIQNVDGFEIRGGGPDIHVFPKFEWQKYGLDLMIYGWDIGEIYRQHLVHIYGWHMIYIIPMYQCHIISFILTVLARARGGATIFKMSWFRIFPNFDQGVGHQISSFSKFKIVYIILHRTLVHWYVTINHFRHKWTQNELI